MFFACSPILCGCLLGIRYQPAIPNKPNPPGNRSLLCSWVCFVKPCGDPFRLSPPFHFSLGRLLIHHLTLKRERVLCLDCWLSVSARASAGLLLNMTVLFKYFDAISWDGEGLRRFRPLPKTTVCYRCPGRKGPGAAMSSSAVA